MHILVQTNHPLDFHDTSAENADYTTLLVRPCWVLQTSGPEFQSMILCETLPPLLTGL